MNPILFVSLVVIFSSTAARADLFFRNIDGEQPGPLLVIVGVVGEHGSSGLAAVDQLRFVTPERGRLILVKSYAPFTDLPEAASGWTKCDSMEQFKRQHPQAQYLILQEDYEARSYSPNANGAVISGLEEYAKPIHQAITESLWDDESSWTYVGSDKPKTIIVITCAKDPRKMHRPARRQHHHRLAALTLMKSLGMVQAIEPSQVFPKKSSQLRVAVYDDDGSISSSGHGPAWLRSELLSAGSDLNVELITRREIQAGGLRCVDVLVFGGGTAGTQASGLGTEGQAKVKEFVEKGGGYVGICAGAYLASQPTAKYKYLGLLPVDAKGNTGDFLIQMEWNHCALSSGEKAMAKYSNGPLLIPEPGEALQIWAKFIDEEEQPSKKKLKETPSVIAGKFGQGRVVIFSPHCERRPDRSTIFSDAVRYAGGKITK